MSAKVTPSPGSDAERLAQHCQGLRRIPSVTSIGGPSLKALFKAESILRQASDDLARGKAVGPDVYREALDALDQASVASPLLPSSQWSVLMGAVEFTRTLRAHASLHASGG